MAYSSLSIKQLVSDITDNKYYLPAIQRKFVWKEEKICKLFDSIMQDYPIGTFLFWDLPKEKADKYTFYKFLENYHERDSKNALVRHDFTKEVRGVLDGQQRISSMYIALQGVYCTKQKYAKTTNNNAYPERKFYLDLLGNDNEYDFRFLSDADVKKEEQSCYYLVRNILLKSVNDDPYDILDELKANNPSKAELIESNRNSARRKIHHLLQKFNDDNLVSYFKIVDKDLDDILDIFVRVNSGGTILSKSDLLFSTLVAHWEDGREKIEKLIDDMNGDDGLFKFNTDFLMRTCLFLVDAPMNFKVKTFDAENIKKIRSNWDGIRNALIRSAKILREFGFNKTRLSSNYAATPLAYYLYQGGIVDDKTKSELRQLVVHSLLKQTFSGQADSALNGLRDGLRIKHADQAPGYKLKNTRFSFTEYQHTKLSGGKKLTIDAEDVEGFLDYKKGAFTFLLLSVLYPDLKLDQISFHQDHMHPYSKFKPSKLKTIGLTDEVINTWLDMRDQLPNLQLLEGQENTQKQATDLAKWVDDNAGDETYYRKRNYILPKQSLNLSDFDDFFINRRHLLRKSLHKLFGIASLDAPAKAIA
jgi:uncharacterized protein with ParB-like and HNH nuclease domain